MSNKEKKETPKQEKKAEQKKNYSKPALKKHERLYEMGMGT